MLASSDGGINEITKAWMQLGRSAGEVDRVGASSTDSRDHCVHDRVGHHCVGSIGTGIHMTVAAGHVAELSHIDLKDFERSGRRGLSYQGIELYPLVLALKPHSCQHLELLGRGSKW